ncbi:MAG: hypothetical protein KGJ98_00490 [Chloroflexota bacterium]|nr:hypothetical protein [Chloroflexota bacterium]
MASILVRHIGVLVSGDLRSPRLDADPLFIENGLIAEVGTRRASADVVVDAAGPAG